MLIPILLCVMAYLIGSLSSAVIVCRMAGLPDPRNVGSKNPGATNVLRLGGKKLAAITLLGDVLKGVIAVALALLIDPDPFVISSVMVAVFLGHLYPIFFGFQGGKGVATAFGAIATLSLSVGGLLIATWGIIFYLFRYSSLAALITAGLAPFYIFLLADKWYVIPVSIMSLMLIFRHRTNIEKLLKGTEPKTGKNS
jgi:acyl phosphate:glycerol-3-phosphate acyltransferase